MRNAHRFLLMLTSTLALVLAPSVAGATVINFSSTIDGPSANGGAGTGSGATGSATLTFDTVTNLFTWSGSFSGLESDYLISHFHGPALPNQNAGVTVGFVVSLNPDNRSGTFNGSATLGAGPAADLLNDLWYINIHTYVDQGGEIRGQVLVPEPGMALLLAFGGAAMVLRRREGEAR